MTVQLRTQRRLSGAVAAVMLASLTVTPANTASKEPTEPSSAMKPAPGAKFGLTRALLEQLRAGGFNIFFRHALTPNYSDPDDTTLDNCGTQRNLSKEGIDQSKALGEAFRTLEIPIGTVRSSPFCRSMDTAWHAFGRVEKDRTLRLSGNEPEKDPSEGKVWRNVRNVAKIPPMPMTNAIFMAHGTVGQIFGAGYMEEGEAVIIEPDGKGGWTLIARVKAEDWKEP